MKNWDADYYDKNSVMQYQTAMTMLNSLSLKGNEVVLDIGSGSGKVTFEIAKKVPRGKIIGLDSSENMIQFANTHYHADNLFFEKGNVIDLSYENYFDIVVSFWTLSWVSDQKKALINIVKSLKENGRMLLMYPLRHDVYNIIDRIIERPEWAKCFQHSCSLRMLVKRISIDKRIISFQV